MFLLIFSSYLHWHYVQAPRAIYSLWFNFVWFVEYFFSITSLFKSLFAPWKRVVAKSRRAWDFEEIASAILANLMSRIIGAIMRTVVIVFGLVIEGVLFVGIIPLYIFWLFAPVILVALFLYGCLLMF